MAPSTGGSKDGRVVGVSEMPRNVKGYGWFQQFEGRECEISNVSMLGLRKGAVKHGALVECSTSKGAEAFARRIEEKEDGPRAKVLADQKAIDKFKSDLAEATGWQEAPPDKKGDLSAKPNPSATENQGGGGRSRSPRRRSRSPPRRKSPSPRRRSPSPRRKSPSPRRRSPSPKRRSPSPRRKSLSPRRKRSPSPRKRSPSPRRRESRSPRRRSRSRRR